MTGKGKKDLSGLLFYLCCGLFLAGKKAVVVEV